MKTILKILALFAILVLVGAVLSYVTRRPLHTPTTGTAPEAATGASIPVTIETIKEQASSTPSISVEYPQFPSLPAGFNDEIRSSVLTRLDEFRKDAADAYQARVATAPRGQTAQISPSDFTFIARWEPAQVNAKYVSFILRIDSYSGGANANQELQTFDYDVAAQRDMSIGDLFPSSPDWLAKLASTTRGELIAHIREAAGPDAPTDQIVAGTQPLAENFKRFTFTDYLFTVYFPKYAVGPGAWGEQSAVIPLKDLR